MAGDVAELGIAFDSEDVKKGSDNLAVLEAMAKRAGVSVDEMQKRVKAAEAGLGTLKPATEQVNAQFQKMEAEITRLTAEINQLKVANDNLTQSMTRTGAATSRVGILHSEAANKVQGLGNEFRSVAMASIATITGITGIASVFSKLITETLEAERVQALLTVTLKATGESAGQSIESLNATAKSLQSVTTFSDEAVGAAQNVLLRFGLVRENFERTTIVATDLAAATGRDLSSAMQMLGRALENPEKGMNALRRSGIILSASTKEQIKDLQEQGKVLEAQNIILDEVTKRFGGAAEAMRGTLGGAIEGLKNAWGDLFEISDKTTSGLTDSINRLAEALGDPVFKEFFDQFGSVFFEALNMFTDELVRMSETLSTLKPSAAFKDFIDWLLDPRLIEVISAIANLNGSALLSALRTAPGGGSPAGLPNTDDARGFVSTGSSGSPAGMPTNLGPLIGTNEAYRKSMEGVGKAADGTKEAITSLNEQFINGVAAMGDAATASEKYEAKVMKLQQQLLDGKITVDAYVRAVAAVEPNMKAIRDVVGDLGNALAQAFIKGQGAAEALGNSLKSISAQAASKSINSLLTGDFASAGLQAAISAGTWLAGKLFGGDNGEEQKKQQAAAAEAERLRVEHEKMIAEAQIRAADYMTRAAAAMEKSDFINSVNKFDAESQKAFDEESKRAGDLAIWQLVAARAAERTKLIADTIEAATNTLAGSQLSDVQTRLKELDDAAIELGNALIYSGMAAGEAADVVRDKLNSALDKLRGTFLDDLTRQLNTLAGGEWINQAADLKIKVDQMRSDAAALGITTGIIDEIYIRSAAKIAQQNNLTGDSLAALEASLNFAPGALTTFANAIENTANTAVRSAQQLASASASLSLRMIQATNDASTLGGALAIFDAQAQQQLAEERRNGGQLLTQLEQVLGAERLQIQQRFADQAAQAAQQAADQAARAQQQAYEEQARAAQQAADEQKRIFDDAVKFLTTEARRIQDYITHLLAGATSPLSPAARLASAQGTFASQKALALTGNREALSGITGNAQDVLDAAKAMFGSSTAFQTIFNDMIAQLQSLPAQVSPEQFIVNAIDAQTQELAQHLVDGFDTIDTNTDGLLTFDEISAALSGMASDSALRAMFTRLDVDASGSISQLEAISGATSATSTNTGSFGTLAANTGSIASTSVGIANTNSTIATNSAELPSIDTNTGNTTSGVGAANSQLTTANNILNAVNTGTAWLQFIQSNTALSNLNESAIAGNTAVGANAATYVLSWLPGQNHATGGYISGRGTGTSDSIPANLSNGEYVVNAADTSWALPVLDAINYGHQMPSFIGNDNSGVISAINMQTRALLGALSALRDTQIETARFIAAPAQEANKRATHGRGRKAKA